MQHLLVTRDFLPEMRGAARRYTALVRRYPEPMLVSTVAVRESPRHDLAEDYSIERQRFSRDAASSAGSRMLWRRWVLRRCRGRIHVLHAGDICVTGRIVHRVHKRLRTPYVVYVSPGSLATAQTMLARGSLGRRAVRLVLGDAAGVIATTDEVASRARDMMKDLGISQPAPVAAIGLGTDPVLFGPGRDTGALRARWGIRRAPIMLTVARLVAEKGQDSGIEALSLLRHEFPNLRYILVGEGPDEARLRNLAADMNVMDRVGFAGSMRDDELPEAYATATIYLDASRLAPDAGEGLGMSLIEAAAAGLPVVAFGGSGVTPPLPVLEGRVSVASGDTRAVADAIGSLLRDSERRNEMGMLGRESAETYLDWNRVAQDTARFVRECVAHG
ncbi:MAG: glycosyltransferase family 4 protein [Gemmatimonadaceae bacterium]